MHMLSWKIGKEFAASGKSIQARGESMLWNDKSIKLAIIYPIYMLYIKPPELVYVSCGVRPSITSIVSIKNWRNISRSPVRSNDKRDPAVSKITPWIELKSTGELLTSDKNVIKHVCNKFPNAMKSHNLVCYIST